MDISRLVPLFTREAIAARVAEMGAQIARDFHGEPLVAVCVLRGAFMFYADLVRAIPKEDLYVDFIRISSYGKSTVSSGHVSLHTDLTVMATVAFQILMRGDELVDFQLRRNFHHHRHTVGDTAR